MAPTSRESPITALRMIIDTAVTESRAMVVCSPGPSMTAEMSTTSISTIESVRTKEP